MKKILFGFILISLCVLISSCKDLLDSNQCDCEIVTSNYNYTIGEWEEINRYFPVFQFVIWGGKSPSDAIESAMLETLGNA